jgi:hypothetical protein
MRRLIALILVSLLLTACGIGRRSRTPSSRLTPVRLEWHADTLAALPACVAEREGWLSHAGFRLERKAGGGTLGPPGAWPVAAVILQRSEWVLASSRAEPDFRWRDLKNLPLGEVALDAHQRSLILGMLAEHGVTEVHWDSVPAQDAPRLLADGHVPWALMRLVTAVRLRLKILAFVGAAQGPVPAAVIQAPSEPPAFLAVLNRALAFVRDHGAGSIAETVKQCYPTTPPALLGAAIRDAQGLGMFSASTYLSPGLFRSGRALAAAGGTAWPDYSSAAHMQDALRALSIWP